MAKRNKPHLVVSTPPKNEAFRFAGSGRASGTVPDFVSDRSGHGHRLKQELEKATVSTNEDDEAKGTTITFISFPGLELALESLDSQSRGQQPQLLSVSNRQSGDHLVQLATVFIPHGKKNYFLKKLDAYIESAHANKATNAKLVEGIQEIRRATIRELWTDPIDLFPTEPEELCWWEVWLRKSDGNEKARFSRFAENKRLSTSDHYLGFGDRTVVLIRATADQLAEAFESLDDFAELRRPHEVASFLHSLPASDQADWVEDLRKRLRAANVDAPAVTILDTGVQEGHPLLSESLASTDVHVADPLWQSAPRFAHGTEMAGLALYGDLQAAILSKVPVQLRHRLESVKFLPDNGANNPDLYGAVTARSVDRPEIAAAQRLRVFMLAVTAPRPATTESQGETKTPQEAGRPTSWSATIDALAYGRAIDDSDPHLTYLDRDEPRHPRLLAISAGNIRDIRASDEYLERNDLEPVEDPAQAWNALTVGAYSEHDDMSGAPEGFANYRPLASGGELSPVSRTSVLFDRKKWPFKPEVVAAGGNVAASPDDSVVDTPPNLAILTTRLQKPGEGFFTVTRDTSAATAQVAAIAAGVRAQYPNLRPESVRALVVHSAKWTAEMESKFSSKASKRELVNLLRRYGMGVPDETRALRSAADALTLISEATIRPYEREGNKKDGTAREMNLHELPWPTRELEELGETQVILRVTLSYFIEPNPSNRGWSGRYIYPSHGLRFAMRRSDESVTNFRQRINTKARIDGRKPPTADTEKGWLFGSDQQKASGSLHTDIWTGDAVALASKGAIAIYPVAGWWKDRPAFDQSDQGVDYSLVVSIESPNVEVDLWTPVAQQISSEIDVEISSLL